MLSELAVYLLLAPEFGGTRFGPFEGLEVRLGANPDRCHIVLPESFGVLAEHVKVIRQGPQNLILAPAERTATVFVWRKGARKPEQLSSPVAVRPGDGFSLVTPSGPRFTVQLDELPPEVKKQREEAARRVGVGRRRLTKESLAAEGKRQIFTRLLVMGPMQYIQRAWIFVKSGAIYQPRNIFFGAFLLSGYIFGGVSSCRGRKSRASLATTSQRLQSCEKSNKFLEEKGENVAEWTFADLAAGVTDSTQIGASLEGDGKLSDMVREEAKFVLQDAKRYEWLLGRGGRAQREEFNAWLGRVEQSERLDNNTRHVVTWLAAQPGRTTGEFDPVENSSGTEVCGRGPLRMTYRQALHLGLQAQPDGWQRGRDITTLEDTLERDALIDATLSDAGMARGEETLETDLEGINQEGACVYADGDDDRVIQGRLLSRLERQLGEKATEVPFSTATHATSIRLGLYYAADTPRIDLRDGRPSIDFANPGATASSVLGQLDSGGDWALKQTARALARSIVLPCRARLEGDPKQMQAIFGDEGLPPELPCLVLFYKLNNA